MIDDLIRMSWPLERLGEALEALARKCKLSRGFACPPDSPEGLAANDEILGQWIKATADKLNLEAQPVFSLYAELDQLIHAGGPALLRLRVGEEPRFLALIGRGWRSVSVLDADLRERKVASSVICSTLREVLEAPLRPQLDLLLERVGVGRRKRAKARRAILRERLSAVMLGGFWLLRLPPGVNFSRQLRHARALRYLGGLMAAHAVQYALLLLAWFVAGRGALQGRLDNSVLVAWALLLLTIIPLRLFTTWTQGALAIRVGSLLKQRLLYGALGLDPDQIRHQGSGQLLGRIMETEAVESLALSGGFQGLLAGIELSIAALVLVKGSGGWPHAGLLVLWTAVTLFIGWRHFRKRQRWTSERMDITNDLVERMVGHRTRLAQEPQGLWHETEDRSLEHYFGSSKEMDRTTVWLSALVARGWLVIGILGLANNFVRGSGSTGSLAVGLGGVILAYAALRRFGAGISQLTDAAIAWQQVALLFHAADLKATTSSESTFVDNLRGTLRTGEVLLDARDLAFRYSDRSEPVIKRCNLRIKTGDKLLIEGLSGIG
jgi:hypothetical protein